jgi:hypothetical protein
MGNGSLQVQAQANFVTLSKEEEGFAYAMDKFVLPIAIRIRSLSHADETRMQRRRPC